MSFCCTPVPESSTLTSRPLELNGFDAIRNARSVTARMASAALVMRFKMSCCNWPRCPEINGTCRASSSSTLLERPGLSGRDFYLLAAELPYDKAVEAFIVRAAVVAQKPDCLLLANKETVDAIGAVVHAGGVATKSNVAGELIDFVPKG